MPRMRKKMKLEWAFFIGQSGRREYNALCLRCIHNCKQSFRAKVIRCDKYVSKRKNCSD